MRSATNSSHFLLRPPNGIILQRIHRRRAVIVAAAFTLSLYAFGAQSAQMALHIGLMNLAAPLLSAALKGVRKIGWRS